MYSGKPLVQELDGEDVVVEHHPDLVLDAEHLREVQRDLGDEQIHDRARTTAPGWSGRLRVGAGEPPTTAPAPRRTTIISLEYRQGPVRQPERVAEVNPPRGASWQLNPPNSRRVRSNVLVALGHVGLRFLLYQRVTSPPSVPALEPVARRRPAAVPRAGRGRASGSSAREPPAISFSLRGTPAKGGAEFGPRLPEGRNLRSLLKPVGGQQAPRIDLPVGERAHARSRRRR